MKAIITIGFEEYLVGDARKALALVEMLRKSDLLASHGGYMPNQINLSGEEVRVEMRSLPTTTKIVPAKKGKA
jgi:hypothetical protein